jgi:hypothetical protein
MGSRHLERVINRIDALRPARNRKFENMTVAELREYLQRELSALGLKCANCGKAIGAAPADDEPGGWAISRAVKSRGDDNDDH